MLSYQRLVLAYTETCLFRCEHCIIDSSPDRNGKMSIQDAKRYITSAYKTKIPCIGITGGEPFLHFQEILDLIEFSSTLGMGTSVITNGYWAIDRYRTAKMLSQLVEKGLDTLGVSCDEFHQRHIPLSNLHILADLCNKMGLEMILNICRTSRSPTSCEYRGIKAKIHEQNLFPLGRASNLSDDLFIQYDAPPQGSCENIRLPMIDWDGQIFACCGPSLFSARTSPLRLGNVNESGLRQTLLRAAEEPILEALSVWGPYGLLSLLEDGECDQLYHPRQRYPGGTCILCLDLLNSPDVVAALRTRLGHLEIKRRLEAALVISNYRISARAKKQEKIRLAS